MICNSNFFSIDFTVIYGLMRITIILVLLLLSGCSSTGPYNFYKVVNDKDDWSDGISNKKLIIIKNGGSIPADVADMLNKHQSGGLNKRMRIVEDYKARVFIQATQLLLNKQYLPAYKTLAAYPDSEFNYQAGIVKLDCLIEMKTDTVDFQKKYQELYDNVPDVKLKQVILTRFRFYKYGL